MAIASTGLTESDLRAGFFEAFSPKVDDALYLRLAERIPSTKDAERHRWLGSLPSMQEWGPGLRLHGLRSDSYDVANMKYAVGLEADRDEVDDDQTGQIVKRAGQLGSQARLHKDELLGDLIENGGTAGFTSYDGKVFFAADHESGDSGAQDNDLAFTVADNDVNVFTAAEGETMLQNAIATMMNFKDDRGRPFKTRPTGLVLVCPITQLFRWQKVVQTALISNTDNIMRGVADVVAFAELSNTSGAWYLFKTDDAGARPFIFQDRMAVETEFVGPGSEHYILTEKLIFKVRARYRLAYGFWPYAVRTVNAT